MTKGSKILVAVLVVAAVVGGAVFYFKDGGDFGGRIFKLNEKPKIMSSREFPDSTLTSTDIKKLKSDDWVVACVKAYAQNGTVTVECERVLYYYDIFLPQLTSLRCERVMRFWVEGDWTYRVGSSNLPAACVTLYADRFPHSPYSVTHYRCGQTANVWKQGDWTYRFGNDAKLVGDCREAYPELFE